MIYYGFARLIAALFVGYGVWQHLEGK